MLIFNLLYLMTVAFMVPFVWSQEAAGYDSSFELLIVDEDGGEGADSSFELSIVDEDGGKGHTGPLLITDNPEEEMSTGEDEVMVTDIDILQSTEQTTCPLGLWGPDCANTCNCRSLTDCDVTTGCTACSNLGFTGPNCSTDIDECEQNPCGNNTVNCTNTIASFLCICEEGYRISIMDKLVCEDIDECAALNPCQNGGKCNNLENDYSCDCKPGFIGKNCSTSAASTNEVQSSTAVVITSKSESIVASSTKDYIYSDALSTTKFEGTDILLTDALTEITYVPSSSEGGNADRVFTSKSENTDAPFTSKSGSVDASFTSGFENTGGLFTTESESDDAPLTSESGTTNTAFTRESGITNAAFTSESGTINTAFTSESEITNAAFTSESGTINTAFTSESEITNAAFTSESGTINTAFTSESEITNAAFTIESGTINTAFTSDSGTTDAAFNSESMRSSSTMSYTVGVTTESGKIFTDITSQGSSTITTDCSSLQFCTHCDYHSEVLVCTSCTDSTRFQLQSGMCVPVATLLPSDGALELNCYRSRRMTFYTEDMKINNILYHYPRIHVSCDGWAAIESAYSPYFSLQSPRDWQSAITQWRRYYANFYGLTVLAAFWSTVSSGTVYYQEYGKYHVNSTFMLSEIQMRLNMYISTVDPTFVCDYAVVITFEDMLPLNPDDEDDGNTYQIVIAMEERNLKTYVMFLYNKIGWKSQRIILIGHYLTRYFGGADEDISSYSNLESLSTNLLARRIATDINPLTGLPGERYLTLSSSSEYFTNYRRICVDWYRDEILINPVRPWLGSTQNYFRSLTNRGLLRQCPCDLRSMRLGSFGFWRYDFETSNFPWTSCYVQRRSALGVSTSSCCYSNSWFGILLSFSSRYFLYNPITHPEEHYRYDTLPFQQCCRRSKFCYYYSMLRPRVPCNWRSRFFRGWFWGDPHITTLDGVRYTFNGLGEYVLLETTDTTEPSNVTSFKVQGRTHKAIDENGTETSATVFSAFAIQDNGSTVLHIEMTEARNGVLIFNDIRNITRMFIDTEINDTLEAEGVTISKDSDTKTTFTFDSEVSVTVTLAEQALSISLTCPENFINRTVGLLGKFNQDAHDDFTSRNGTVHPINMPESEIFDKFGETWRLFKNESLFHYHSGMAYDDFNPLGYRPVFLDELRENYTEAEWQDFNKTCKGNTECIFDYAVTGSNAVAESTLTTDEENTEIQQDLAISRPVITVPDWVNITLGQNVTIEVTAKDNDIDDTVTITFNLTQNNGNNSIDISNEAKFQNTGEIYTFSWMPKTSDEVNLTFQAEDSKGGLSPPEVVKIRFCRCNDSLFGECDFNRTVVGTDEDANFQIVECNCTSGYEGDYCTEDINGCADNPCGCLVADNCTGPNTWCEDVAADDNNGSLPYECGPCNPGYERKLEGENGECTDTNECKNDNFTCPENSKCVNIIGSYVCECFPGYRQTGDGCQDIDECGEQSAGCDHLCRNTNGSFVCSCFDGFYLNKTTNTTCRAETEVEKLCESFSCENCRNGRNGMAECFCLSGYELHADSVTCEDIDECLNETTNKCNSSISTCTNIEGSYRCQCSDGFKLHTDKRTCEACSPGLWGPDCANTCACRSLADCDVTNGCTNCTNPGFTGPNCSTDIDECEENLCGNNTVNCANTIGSFLCICEEGYRISPTDNLVCEDIDECVPAYPCQNGGKCNNLDNNYSCDCKPEFTGKNCSTELTTEATSTLETSKISTTELSTTESESTNWPSTMESKGTDRPQSTSIGVFSTPDSTDGHSTMESGSTDWSSSSQSSITETNSLSGLFVITSISWDANLLIKESDDYLELSADIAKEFQSFCKASDGIGSCEVIDISFRPGSVIAEFILKVPAAVNDQVLFDALAEAITEDKFFGDYDIDADSLAVGNVVASEGLSTIEILTIAISVGLSATAIVFSVVAILIVRRNKGSSTAERRISNLSIRGIITDDSSGEGTNENNEKCQNTAESLSSQDGSNDINRMKVIQNALDKTPDIDWSAVRNIRIKSSSPSDDNLSQSEVEETVFRMPYDSF